MHIPTKKLNGSPFYHCVMKPPLKILPYILGALACILVVLFLQGRILLTLLLLILIGSISLLYKLFINIPLGFELVTLVTVLAGNGISAKAGIFVGLITPLIGLSLALKSFKNPSDTLLNMIFMALVGYLASYIPTGSIAIGGFVLTIVFDMFYIPTRYIISPNIGKYALYLAGHWLFNFALFRALGPLGLALISH